MASAGGGLPPGYCEIVTNNSPRLVHITGPGIEIEGTRFSDNVQCNTTIGVTIDGAAGDDHLSGGSGNDLIIGGSGNDGLGGNAGNDTLNGGPGSDVIDAGDGTDVCNGGPGNDAVFLCETISLGPQ